MGGIVGRYCFVQSYLGCSCKFPTIKMSPKNTIFISVKVAILNSILELGADYRVIKEFISTFGVETGDRGMYVEAVCQVTCVHLLYDLQYAIEKVCISATSFGFSESWHAVD